MRALLTPEVVPRLGVVLLKPGNELMRLFTGGRIVVEQAPGNMSNLSTGRIPDARQPLSEDESLLPFFSDERVIRAAGGISGLDAWLMRNCTACQNPHADYHHHELVTTRHQPGSILFCWHCDNQLREQTTSFLEELASRNVIAWVIDSVLSVLGFNRERELSLAELCWWAVYSGIADAITEPMARRALRMPGETVLSVYRESEIVPAPTATSVVREKARPAENMVKGRSIKARQSVDEQQKPVLILDVDPDSPQAFMLLPKRKRWVSDKYTRWVKSQPCSCCQRPADDPHHVIGHGMGGMATKAHDLFVFPLCRECHDELHADLSAFERKNGTQLELLFRFLDRALAVAVLVKA